MTSDTARRSPASIWCCAATSSSTSRPASSGGPQRFAFALRPGGYLVLGKAEQSVRCRSSSLWSSRVSSSSAALGPMPRSRNLSGSAISRWTWVAGGRLDHHAGDWRRRAPRPPASHCRPRWLYTLLAELSVGVMTVNRDYDIRSHQRRRALAPRTAWDEHRRRPHSSALGPSWRPRCGGPSMPPCGAKPARKPTRRRGTLSRASAGICASPAPRCAVTGRRPGRDRAGRSRRYQPRPGAGASPGNRARTDPDGTGCVAGADRGGGSRAEAAASVQSASWPVSTSDCGSTMSSCNSAPRRRRPPPKRSRPSTRSCRRRTRSWRPSTRSCRRRSRSCDATNDELHARTSELELMASELEEQRRASEVEHARLEAILANMADAVLVVDRQAEGRSDQCRLRAALRGGVHPTGRGPGQPLRRRTWPQHRAAQGESFTQVFTLPAQDGYVTGSSPTPSRCQELKARPGAC